MKHTIPILLLFLSLIAFAGCVQVNVKYDNPPEPTEAPVTEETATVAKAGVSGKGDYSSAPMVMQPITVPISTYFLAKERTVFEMQIPTTMRLFEAENGRKPDSHEEYMEEIINKGMIKLPALKNADDRYEYDPTDGELKVVTKVAK